MPIDAYLRRTPACRMIAGTLVRVGLGKLKPEDVNALLEAKGRSGEPISTYKAPACGLCMEAAFYGTFDSSPACPPASSH